jgi:hypothetical protein
MHTATSIANTPPTPVLINNIKLHTQELQVLKNTVMLSKEVGVYYVQRQPPQGASTSIALPLCNLISIECLGVEHANYREASAI